MAHCQRQGDERSPSGADRTAASERRPFAAPAECPDETSRTDFPPWHRWSVFGRATTPLRDGQPSESASRLRDTAGSASEKGITASSTVSRPCLKRS
jgi:hypothetical protein